MRTVAVMLLLAALAAAVFAIVYEGRDWIVTRGGTMGAAMTAGVIWALAALLNGIGSLLLWGWSVSAAAVVATLALSFLVRRFIPRVLSGRVGR